MANQRKMLSDSIIFLFSLLLLFFNTMADDVDVMRMLATSLSPTPSGWSGSKPCKWSGVTCDDSNRITSINLAFKSLSGTLPSDLNQLTKLTTLSLQSNQLSGPIPSLSNLTNLEEVYLDSNNFTSVPPSLLSGLTSLQTLSISENINLGPWSIPAELAQSSALVSFYAVKANIVGSVPDFFNGFPNLQSLRLSYNNLTGSLPVSFNGSGIKNLWLNNQAMGLSGSIDILGTMTQLSQVWLHQNSFTGAIPDLSNCASLFDLQLRGNQLTGVVPVSLISLRSLANVSLENNMLQGPFPDFHGGVKVSLGSTNSFCDTKPGPCASQVTALLEVAGALGYPRILAETWKGNDPCKGWSFVTCDAEGKHVTVINFARKDFTGTISPTLANLTSLRNLVLNDNNLSGPIPDSLAGLTDLQILDVSNNNLTGKIPDFSPRVAVRTTGNRFLGNNPDTIAPSSDGGPSKKHNTAGAIAGTAIAVVLFIGTVCFIIYRCYTKKQHLKFGLLGSPQYAKEMVKNGLPATQNGYDGVAIGKHSQSSFANNNIQVYRGGNVAISIQVLRQVTNNFSEANILGRGGFGVVYKGELHDGTQVAVKRMESTAVGTTGMIEFQAELGVLTKVRHRHLVALLGYCINGNERLLVYEYMPLGTLAQHLFGWSENGYSPLTWKQRVTMALDVARGLEYLHSLAQQCFIHRDLKPSNILVGDDMRAKVADFGLVKNAPDDKCSMVTRLAGTFGYLAPEYAATGRVTTKVDVYAFGVVLMELITGRKALDDTMPEERTHLVTWFRRVVINMDNMRNGIDPTLKPDDETFGNICKVAELAGHCTAREPYHRPDMGHAVNILGPLVEHWKPTCHEEDSHSIDIHLSLPEALQRWQTNEGTATMINNLFHM